MSKHSKKIEKLIHLKDDGEARVLFGRHDESLKLLENSLGIATFFENGVLKLTGDKSGVEKAVTVLEEILITIRKGGDLGKHDIAYDHRTKKDHEVISQISSLVKKLLHKNRIEETDLMGIGVGFPQDLAVHAREKCC